MDSLAEVLGLLAVALLGYLAGQRFPGLGGRIARWVGRRRAAAVRPPGPWRPRSRVLAVVIALAATVPVWPVVQPGDPVADELLSPADVAVAVPVVLLFPVAWALLGRCRPAAWRVAAVLAGCVAAWSLWTVTAGSYATPPNVDDGLRCCLAGTGVLVAGAAIREGRPHRMGLRWAAGVLVWTVGVAATASIPVVGREQLPPPGLVLPLPATMTVVHEDARCAPAEQFGPRSCVRVFTVAATGGAEARELARALGEHLERTKGWAATWYDPFTVHFGCRRVGRLNPYAICVELRRDEPASTVRVWLAFYNAGAGVVY